MRRIAGFPKTDFNGKVRDFETNLQKGLNAIIIGVQMGGWTSLFPKQSSAQSRWKKDVTTWPSVPPHVIMFEMDRRAESRLLKEDFVGNFWGFETD